MHYRFSCRLSILLYWKCIGLYFLICTEGAPRPLVTLIPPAEVLSNNTIGGGTTRYNINKGAAFNISCKYTHTSDAFTVSFFKDGVVIGGGDLVDTTLSETVFSPNQRSYHLQFLNFQPVHDGVYHCTVTRNDTNQEGSSDLYLYGSGEDGMCVCMNR